MELTQHGFLEELRCPWNSIPERVNEFFPNEWNFDPFDEIPVLGMQQNPSVSDLFLPTAEEPTLERPFSESFYPLIDEFTSNLSQNNTNSPTFPIQECYHPPLMVKHEEEGGSFEQGDATSRRADQIDQAADAPVFNMGISGDRKKKAKKSEGQPSKNLMAERRRRKRLNDRLSMLRSIVPKISKMDRTSILGDTIDYLKELLERVNKLREEDKTEMGTNQINRTGRLGDLKPNGALVRNSSKFDVERGEADTRIKIQCATKQGLLLSTVNTLEALGLEIQQCVISCFSDFSMQASCSEEAAQQATLRTEDIKQALFTTAGYGGRGFS